MDEWPHMLAVTEEMAKTRVALERIATALERLTAPAAAAETAGCPHPEEMRVNFGGMGQTDGFFCKACGTNVEPERLEAVTGG